MRTTFVAAVCLLGLCAPAAADAQSTGTDPGAPAPSPAPSTPPAPVAGRLSLAAERVGPARSVVSGARWRVRGRLMPFVAGQRVTVRFARSGRQIAVRRVAVRPTTTGRSGAFVVSFASRLPGRIAVRASHAATPELATAVARPVAVDVLPTRVPRGSSGLGVRMLQQRLAQLGYVVGRRGRFDARTARAVLTLRKVLGLRRTTVADRAVLTRLARGQGSFRVRFPRHGRHVEADVSRQVVALIGAGGRVERIYPTSSGAPATPTVLGSYRVYRKDFGTNALGMVHAAYFIGGYAIHGFRSVPTYNASHGCLRVPVPDALSIFRWIRYGTRVDTYR